MVNKGGIAVFALCMWMHMKGVFFRRYGRNTGPAANEMKAVDHEKYKKESHRKL